MRPGSDAPPQASVIPPELLLEAPGDISSAPLVILNRGGGRLNGALSADQPWVRVSHPQINDNNTKVEVEIDLSALPLEQTSHATLTLRTADQVLEIPVKALRYGFPRALDLYRSGRHTLAKDACRRLMQAECAFTEAAFLLTAMYLDEGNFPSALRVLQDLTSAANLKPASVELPDEIPLTILAQLASHPGSMRSMEHGIPTLERMEHAVGPAVQPALRRAQRQAYVDYLRDHLEERRAVERDDEAAGPPDPAMRQREHELASEVARSAPVRVASTRTDSMPDDEVRRIQGYVKRARERFPDDPLWAEVGGDLHAVLAQRNRHALRRRLALLGAIAGVALAMVAAVYVTEALKLRAARRALGQADYATAVANAAELLSWNPDLKEARQLRAQANFEWSKSLFARGQSRVGADRLEAALRDLPGDAALLDTRRRVYLEWAERLLKHRQISEAYGRFKIVAEMTPQDATLTRKLASLEGLKAFYDVLHRIARAPGTHPASPDPLPLPVAMAQHADEAAAWRHALQQHGLRPYGQRMQVMLLDVDGDGADEIVIGGNDHDGHSGLAVYATDLVTGKDGRVSAATRPILQLDGGADHFFAQMQVRRLGALPREVRVVQADWLRSDGAALGHSVLLWHNAAGLHAWRDAASPYPLQVRDARHNGQPEVWIRRMVGSAATPETAVAVPIPYRWANGRAVDGSVDFSDYFLDELLPDIERQRSSHRFPTGDPRAAQLEENCKRAIAMVRALAGK